MQPGPDTGEADYPPAALEESSFALPEVVCWRCEKPSAGVPTCPYCRAVLSTAADHDAQRLAAAPHRQLHLALGFLGALLATSVVATLVIYVHATRGREPAWELEIWVRNLTAVLAGVDTMLVLVACGLIQVPATPPIPREQQLVVWLVATLVMAGCLVLNFYWSHWLRELVPQELGEQIDFKNWGEAWVVMLFIVQPAIIEELFFRRILLSSLKGVMDTHAAVWVTATAFGMLHIYNPLGVPYLIVLGGLLGYARIGSGTIWLPVFLHALHNAVVIPWE